MIDDRIFQLREKLSANLAHNWTLEEMAETIGLSKSHLLKLFKKDIEITPFAFLHEKRLEKARELLEGDWEQISLIGRQVAMPNESYFTREFKKRYGLTPTAYRKKYHDERQAKIISEQK